MKAHFTHEDFQQLKDSTFHNERRLVQDKSIGEQSRIGYVVLVDSIGFHCCCEGKGSIALEIELMDETSGVIKNRQTYHVCVQRSFGFCKGKFEARCMA
jgi:hypothetical protein